MAYSMENAINALEVIEQFSTGFKHGTEGSMLLRIQDLARNVICTHVPVILHRSGGERAGIENTCGKCGRMIRCIEMPGHWDTPPVKVWCTDFVREAE